MDKQELINFEKEVVELFNDGQLRSPVHLSGGNEDQLIAIFERIKPQDWVFSTYRGHYHALLHGIDKGWLKQWILDNKSIHVMNKEQKFFTSAIVGGPVSIALGTALALNTKKQREMKVLDELKAKGFKIQTEIDDTIVWCFVGDMTAHTGIFWECIKYAHFHKLPINFVIEDNGLSTDTPTGITWGLDNQSYFNILANLFPGRIVYYKYKRTYPHYGTGKFVAKLWEGVDETKKKGF